MQIDFKALEQALAPIEAIGQGELTFDAGGTPITLKVLLPAEELKAQKFAAAILDESGEGTQTTMDYLDRFRLACLSYSVIQVGSMDFRDVQYVETGEKLDSGVAVKIPKDKALRQLMARWTRSTATAVFTKFNELVSRTDLEAAKAIEFEPSSTPAEIDRLQKRIDNLKDQVAQSDAEEKAKFTTQVTTTADVGAPRQKTKEVDPEINPEQVLPASIRRTGPISPTEAPPPLERAPTPPSTESPAHWAPVPLADSSFIDPDGGGMDAALAAEHNRIAAMRQATQQGQPPVDDASALQTTHPQRRMPPHLEAREVEQEVGVLDVSNDVTQEVGEIDGKPVFALPAQRLDAHATQASLGSRAVLDQHGPSSKNPRFTGHKP